MEDNTQQTQIPTAREILEKWSEDIKIHFGKMANDLEYRAKHENEYVGLLDKRLIEFAQLHCKAALQSAAKKAKIRVIVEYEATTGFEINENSILNAYPDNLIK